MNHPAGVKQIGLEELFDTVVLPFGLLAWTPWALSLSAGQNFASWPRARQEVHGATTCPGPLQKETRESAQILATAPGGKTRTSPSHFGIPFFSLVTYDD